MKKIREIGRPDGSIRYFAREGALLRNRRFAPLDVRGWKTREQVIVLGCSTKLAKSVRKSFFGKMNFSNKKLAAPQKILLLILFYSVRLMQYTFRWFLVDL